jgi:hypothetical protein
MKFFLPIQSKNTPKKFISVKTVLMIEASSLIKNSKILWTLLYSTFQGSTSKVVSIIGTKEFDMEWRKMKGWSV